MQLALADAVDTVEGDKLLARTVKESGWAVGAVEAVVEGNTRMGTEEFRLELAASY
jgi:hypothetical protein